ncbi:methyltransferase domain-containing protein [Pseudenhygromyxa sp. WMMC2535]|uniref:methyltransferase domain-containing protein n=1 Tax=Pseudenhygromyxa sp. WMMC2535 TaxID=2712867 RepID=UPI001553DEDD|nr:methyltransferase domain-containing protein [Pseudenhygromyxa sp. WMMC2535]NVB37102.1 methyltransferase domain-containing protein [Pseudenhygromyxa sp. WMMC2535]
MNDERREPAPAQDDPTWAAFLELFGGLPRQGPGDAATTRAILELVPSLPAAPRIVDAGCGSGAALMVLAEALPTARTTGVDVQEELLARLRTDAARAGFGDRVDTQRASMDTLALRELDLIWSEGAVFTVGVEQALRSWAPCLRPGAAVVFSEACWFVPADQRPPALVEFWRRAYPSSSTRPASPRGSRASAPTSCARPGGSRARRGSTTTTSPCASAARPCAQAPRRRCSRSSPRPRRKSLPSSAGGTATGTPSSCSRGGERPGAPRSTQGLKNPVVLAHSRPSMSAAEVDALLERLVAQFESPYDFLRELVQNAMDAGSDRVEVTLEAHPLAALGVDAGGAGDDEVVFELVILDTGGGMDEAIIDRELTRLFSSGKDGDQTMAGGFGVGFVSVFAWQPEAVLLHTGRDGECWELVFHADRSFEKLALEDPVEGTTVSLFRRGRASEREAIAEAIRDSLWRWCRFCPLELSFEDLSGEDPPELIQDSPELAENSLVSRAELRGETTLRVAFATPPNVVLLRRGLILAEGGPQAIFRPDMVRSLGESAKHLQVWADSPQLHTTLARDKVVDNHGREAIEGQLLLLVEQLRRDLIARLVEQVEVGGPDPAEAGEGPTDPAWTRERHAIHATLHAHLGLELGAHGVRPREAVILRDLAHARGLSLATAAERMAGRPLLVATPPALLRADAQPSAESTQGPRSLAEGIEALLAALAPTQLPVIAGDLGDDGPWLRALAELAELELVALERAVATVEIEAEEARGLCGLLLGMLDGLGYERLHVQVGRFCDARGRPERGPVFGMEISGAATPLAFHANTSLPRSSRHPRALTLNRHNDLVEVALVSFTQRPLIAACSLAAAIFAGLDEGPEPADLAKVADRLDRSWARSSGASS